AACTKAWSQRPEGTIFTKRSSLSSSTELLTTLPPLSVAEHAEMNIQAVLKLRSLRTASPAGQAGRGRGFSEVCHPRLFSVPCALFPVVLKSLESCIVAAGAMDAGTRVDRRRRQVQSLHRSAIAEVGKSRTKDELLTQGGATAAQVAAHQVLVHRLQIGRR